MLSHWTGTPWDYATTTFTDGNYIYVRAQRGGAYGAILRIPRCGGKPFVLKEIHTFGRIALGGDWIYWGDYLSPYGVKRVPK